MKKLLILAIVSILGILILGVSAVSAATCQNTIGKYCTVASDCAHICTSVCNALQQPCSGTYNADLGCFQSQCACMCNPVTTTAPSTSSSSSSVSSLTTSTTTTTTTTTVMSDTCSVESDPASADSVCQSTYASDTGRCKGYTKVARRTSDFNNPSGYDWKKGDPVCWIVNGVSKCRCTSVCTTSGPTNGQGTTDVRISGNVVSGSFNALVLAMGEEYIAVIQVEDDKEIDFDDYPGFDPTADDARLYGVTYQDYDPETQELTKESPMGLQYNEANARFEARSNAFNMDPINEYTANAANNVDICNSDPDKQTKTYTGDDGEFTPLGNGQVPEFSNWGLLVALAVIAGVMVVFYVKKKK